MPALLYLLGTCVVYMLKSLFVCNCEYYYSTELIQHAPVQVILHRNQHNTHYVTDSKCKRGILKLHLFSIAYCALYWSSLYRVTTEMCKMLHNVTNGYETANSTKYIINKKYSFSSSLFFCTASQLYYHAHLRVYSLPSPPS